MTAPHPAPDSAEIKRLADEFGKACVRVTNDVTGANIAAVIAAERALHAAIDAQAAEVAALRAQLIEERQRERIRFDELFVKHNRALTDLIDARALIRKQGRELGELEAQLAAERALLDYLQTYGAAVAICPGSPGWAERGEWQFMVGGWLESVSTDIRAAIDAAIAARTGRTS